MRDSERLLWLRISQFAWAVLATVLALVLGLKEHAYQGWRDALMFASGACFVIVVDLGLDIFEELIASRK